MEKNRGFGSKLGFILAAAGSAVGVGNLWGFPYRAGVSGGAAFVLVYILMVLAIGCVVMLSEMYIGKRAGKNVFDAYATLSKKMKWVGMLNVVLPFLIASYYIVIGGWSLRYATNYITNPQFATQGYFGEFVSQSYSPIIFMWIFLIVSAVIVCGGIEKGIEKFSKIAMPLLLLCLVAVAIRSLTLGEGVKEGLDFFILKLDFKSLGFSGVLMAMAQAFFSLSLGIGCMIAYGSYIGKSMKLSTSIFTICGLDTVVAILAGLAIFPAVFAFGFAPSEGPGLMFTVLPQVFSVMPAGGFFGFLFFLLVVFAAVTSIISLLEVISQVAIEKFNLERKKATVILTIALGVLGTFVSLSMGAVPQIKIFGFDLLTFFDELANYVIVPFLASIACITVGYIVKPIEVKTSLLAEGDKFKWYPIYNVLVRYVTPVLTLLVLFSGLVEKVTTIDGYFAIVVGGVFVILATVVANFAMNKRK